jgi:hypothetical protein
LRPDRDLAGLVLTVLCKQIFSSCQGQHTTPLHILTALQSLIACPNAAVAHRMRARSLLLSILASSQSFREDLLDAWTSQARGFGQLPMLHCSPPKDQESIRDFLFSNVDTNKYKCLQKIAHQSNCH